MRHRISPEGARNARLDCAAPITTPRRPKAPQRGQNAGVAYGTSDLFAAHEAAGRMDLSGRAPHNGAPGSTCDQEIRP